MVHSVSPRQASLAPWELNLLLSGLQASFFEPIRDLSLADLTQKVVFLVLITSAWRMFTLAASSWKESLSL